MCCVSETLGFCSWGNKRANSKKFIHLWKEKEDLNGSEGKEATQMLPGGVLRATHAPAKWISKICLVVEHLSGLRWVQLLAEVLNWPLLQKLMIFCHNFLLMKPIPVSVQEAGARAAQRHLLNAAFFLYWHPKAVECVSTTDVSPGEGLKRREPLTAIIHTEQCECLWSRWKSDATLTVH